MTKPVYSLPKCNIKEMGESRARDGQNEFNSTLKTIAESKNWVVKGM